MRAAEDVSSYGFPSSPLSTSYGIPLAEPLNSYGVPLAEPINSYDADQDIIDLYSEASDNFANQVTESDITSDRNLKMLMASVPGVPGEDYPILADVLSAGDTGFNCQGKIVGGEH